MFDAHELSIMHMFLPPVIGAYSRAALLLHLSAPGPLDSVGGNDRTSHHG
jgi:hypothetical protein